MKAEINGIKLEGTPQEVAEAIRLAGITRGVAQPIYPQYPVYPIYPVQPIYPQSPAWYGAEITCDTVSARTEQTASDMPSIFTLRV